MGSVLSAVDDAVERFGGAAVADPVALGGALRTVADPPAEPEIAVLTQVAGTGAIPRMRSTLGDGGSAEDALEAAVEAAGSVDAGDAAARWACTMLGAALGLLPRAWATPFPGTVPADPPRPSRRRRGPILIAAVALLVAGVSTFVVLQRPAPQPATVAAVPAAAAPPTAAATTTAAPQPGSSLRKLDFSGNNTIDPRSAFTDPGLLALSEPYLHGRGADCVPMVPAYTQQESVGCYLGGPHTAIFSRFFTLQNVPAGPEAVATLSRPGTTRSLRWKFAAGRPGVKTDVPAGSGETGEGIRIRSITTAGEPSVYFVQESARSSVLLGSADPAESEDALLAYWADPPQ